MRVRGYAPPSSGATERAGYAGRTRRRLRPATGIRLWPTATPWIWAGTAQARGTCPRSASCGRSFGAALRSRQEGIAASPTYASAKAVRTAVLHVCPEVAPVRMGPTGQRGSVVRCVCTGRRRPTLAARPTRGSSTSSAAPSTSTPRRTRATCGVFVADRELILWLFDHNSPIKVPSRESVVSSPA